MRSMHARARAAHREEAERLRGERAALLAEVATLEGWVTELEEARQTAVEAAEEAGSRAANAANAANAASAEAAKQAVDAAAEISRMRRMAQDTAAAAEGGRAAARDALLPASRAWCTTCRSLPPAGQPPVLCPATRQLSCLQHSCKWVPGVRGPAHAITSMTSRCRGDCPPAPPQQQQGRRDGS